MFLEIPRNLLPILNSQLLSHAPQVNNLARQLLPNLLIKRHMNLPVGTRAQHTLRNRILIRESLQTLSISC